MAVLVLDASVVIALLDAADVHHAAAFAALPSDDSSEIVLPASAYAEVLVGPRRRGPAAVARAEGFLSEYAVRIHPIDGYVARRAAALRAGHHRLRLPDALVLATGDVLHAAGVLTADRAWLTVSGRARAI